MWRAGAGGARCLEDGYSIDMLLIPTLVAVLVLPSS